jgi:hypothetical protein
MSLLAPSIAAAFLGSLAFVAWLLWLRRTDPLAAWAEERRAVQETLETLRKGEAAFRAEMTKLTALAGGDAEKLAKRVGALELKVLGRQAP